MKLNLSLFALSLLILSCLLLAMCENLQSQENDTLPSLMGYVTYYTDSLYLNQKIDSLKSDNQRLKFLYDKSLKLNRFYRLQIDSLKRMKEKK